MINLNKYFWPTAESEWIDIFCVYFVLWTMKICYLLFFRINKDINIISNPGCIINLVSRQPQQLLVKWPNKCELWPLVPLVLHLIDQGIKEIEGVAKNAKTQLSRVNSLRKGALLLQIQQLIDLSNSFNVLIRSAPHDQPRCMSSCVCGEHGYFYDNGQKYHSFLPSLKSLNGYETLGERKWLVTGLCLMIGRDLSRDLDTGSWLVDGG